MNSYGNGMEKAGVYAGLLSFMDISIKMPINMYLAYMFGGFLRKIGCRIRPYESIKGETDRMIEKSIQILVDAFSGNRSKEAALAAVISLFESIDISYERKPKVAIFGDLYVRDNAVMNQDLLHFIEENGGEVITTPYSSYLKMIANQYLRKWFTEGKYISVLSSKAWIALLSRLEKMYAKYFERILNEPEPEYNESAQKILSAYHVRQENTGESMENILKIFYIKKHHPDVSLFLQTNPAFCCPSLVTEAMAKHIEKVTDVPVVSITYDGTGGNKNDIIIPYLKYPKVDTSDSLNAHDAPRRLKF